MWLLSTDRAELREFHGPDDPQLQRDGGYAILSHVWEGKEQTFKEVQDLHAICEKEGKHVNPRDRASVKVRQCCLIASRHGCKWIWDDTCCINKDSSSELSEAINSMFRYYSLAKVCFAYLYDVPHTQRSELRAADSRFRRSKWHTRGWTLQELIAPPFLIFLSDNWDILGTKVELAGLLEEITRVPASVLRLTEPVNNFSVACRMSWAANRETTRVEDTAYCLMGIFLINMPTMYGEEERAFVRLQEEIMKQSVDSSLFVWEDRVQNSIGQSRRDSVNAGPEDTCDHTISRHFLLAPSPKVFSHSTAVLFKPTLIQELQKAWKVKASDDHRLAIAGASGTHSRPCIPSFSVTPYGIQAHVPVMDVHGQGFSVAWLGCVNTNTDDVIGLCITPCHSPLDPTRQLYHTGYPGTLLRTVAVKNRFSDALLWQQNCAEWRDIHIANRPPPSPAINLYTPSDYTLSPPYRFPMQALKTCLRDHGYLVDVSQMPFDWDGSTPVIFKFHAVPHEYAFIKIYMVLGCCFVPHHHDDPSPNDGTASRPPQHWAYVLFDEQDRDSTNVPLHVCSEDHITAWPDRSRTFSWRTNQTLDIQVKLTLSFRGDQHSPTTTLVPHVTHGVEGRPTWRRLPEFDPLTVNNDDWLRT